MHLPALKYNPRVISHNNGGFLRQELEKIGVHPRGIERIFPRSQFLAVKLENISRPQCHIIKQGMLAAGGDAAVNWQVVSEEVDRSNIILLGTNEEINRFSQHLQAQPFDLPQIGQLIQQTIERFKNTPSTIPYPAVPAGRQGGALRLDKTNIMGILNVTPDSFSDGGKFYDRNQAIEHALRMIEHGADIIDVGGESTRPGAAPVSIEEELTRTIPVIKGIKQAQPEALISIDTYKAQVAETALQAGAQMVNDISGFGFDSALPRIIAQYKVPVIIMHLQGTPRNMQENPVYQDLISEMVAYFRERIKTAMEAGIPGEQIIIDPGIGFGKKPEHNYEILNRLDEFKTLGQALMLGPSRKSFIGYVLNLPVNERLEGTAAAVTLAISKGAQIIRVHDVKEMVRVARICDYLKLQTKDVRP